MVMISGLPAPNPYAPSVAKPKSATAPANSSATVVNLPERAALNHAAFTPDWMQANHAAQATAATAGVYSAKGELQKLPEPVASAKTAEQPEAAVQDNVDFSSEYAVHYAVLPGSGKA